MSDEATQCIQYSPNKPNKLRKFHIHFLRPPPSKLFQYQRKLKLASCVKWKQNLFYTLQTQEESGSAVLYLQQVLLTDTLSPLLANFARAGAVFPPAIRLALLVGWGKVQPKVE